MRNAVNLCLSNKWIAYIKKIEKSNESKIIDEAISNDLNIALYDVIKEKLTYGIFKNRIGTVDKTVINGKEKFLCLSVPEQIRVLQQIIQSLSINGFTCDLKLIGGSANIGGMFINKKITGNAEFKLITQSVTGIYEKEIDLLTI